MMSEMRFIIVVCFFSRAGVLFVDVVGVGNHTWLHWATITHELSLESSATVPVMNE